MQARFTPVSLLAALGCLAAMPAQSQKIEQVVKPPKIVLWMDASTGSMAGMPDLEMPGMGGLMGGLMGAMGSMGSKGNADAKNTSKHYYGNARGLHVSPPRILDVALWNGLKPGVEAAQRVPAGLKMGDTLPLLPVIEANIVEKTGRTIDGDREVEAPKGRLLFYWGCSATVKPGQPRILDFSKMTANSAQAFGSAFSGRYVPDRGAKVRAGYDVFPNERDQRNLPKGASLVGEHRVVGDSLPDSFKFTLGAAHDVMPPIELQSNGTLKDSITLQWAPVTNARAYFMNAMAIQGDDMIFWSSSEIPDSGFELFTYLSNANIDKWTKEKVLLDGNVTQCAVPKGIFAPKEDTPAKAERDERSMETAFLRMIAYGGEHGFVHPPRPTDPKVPWEQEWFVRLRVKSQTMAMLGVDMGEESRPARKTNKAATRTTDPVPPESKTSPEEEGGLKATLPEAVNLLKGLFGR